MDWYLVANKEEEGVYLRLGRKPYPIWVRGDALIEFLDEYGHIAEVWDGEELAGHVKAEAGKWRDYAPPVRVNVRGEEKEGDG